MSSKIEMFIPLDEYYFDVDENIISKVQLMSPREYIDKVILGFDVTLEEILQSADDSAVKDYAACMLKGDKFPLVHLSYTTDIGFSQEGRHRSMAVQCLIDSGAIPKDTQIPVVVITERQRSD